MASFFAALLPRRALLGTRALSSPAAPATFSALLDSKLDEYEHKSFAKFKAEGNWSATRMQFQTKVDAAAAGMAQLNLQRGDVVLTWLPNSVEAVIAHLAFSKIGVIPLAVNFDATPDDLVALAKRFSSPAMLIGQKALPVVSKAVPELPLTDVRHETFVSKAVPDLKYVFVDGAESRDGCYSWRSLFVYGNPAKPVAPHALALMVASSATAVKGYSFAHISGQAAAISKALSLSETDRLLITSSLSSPHGLAGVIAALVSDATTIIPSFEFDAKQAVAAVASDKVTALLVDAAHAGEIAAAGKLSTVTRSLVVGQGGSATLPGQIEATAAGGIISAIAGTPVAPVVALDPAVAWTRPAAPAPLPRGADLLPFIFGTADATGKITPIAASAVPAAIQALGQQR